MSYCCDDSYDSYVETEHVARIEHTCSACSEQILAGHRYTRVYTLFDGGKNTVKRCTRCQAIHLHLRELGDQTTWPDEWLACGESYEDEWGPCPDEIAVLAFLLPGESSLPNQGGDMDAQDRPSIGDAR